MSTDITGQLLITAGDNPERLRSESALTRLLGIAPLPTSSATTTRHHLHRGGDRHGNTAIYRSTVVRRHHDTHTQRFLTDRITQDKTKPMITHSLTRYLVHEIYQALMTDLNTPENTPPDT